MEWMSGTILPCVSFGGCQVLYFKTICLLHETNLLVSFVCQELGSLKHMKLIIRRQCLNHSPWRVSLALKVDNDNDGCRKKRFAVDGDDDGLLV